MKNNRTVAISRVLLAAVVPLLGSLPALAQIRPEEILNPQLKELERAHFQQLLSLNRAIGAAKFPFPLVVSRYVGLEPKDQAGNDTRGIEFVDFGGRFVLKISANYNASFNANRLTPNQRADRVFHEVVTPVLRIAAKELPQDLNCDNVGLEIGYHVRTRERNADYEAKEILVVLLEPRDALTSWSLPTDPDWQGVLNRSEIYLNGQPFGLALGESEPRNVQVASKSGHTDVARSGSAGSSGSASPFDLPVPQIQRQLWPNYVKSVTQEEAARQPVSAQDREPVANGSSVPLSAAPAKPPDLDALYAKYQTQLDALAKAAAAKFRLVEYDRPSFALFQDRIVLQLTLRNSSQFDKDMTSIYKRAAQSFDLFLAPHLKSLLDMTPEGKEYSALDITILNQLTSKKTPASEAIEFVCPVEALRQFANGEIPNQQLIDFSIVLVNGVRIALNLQIVE